MEQDIAVRIHLGADYRYTAAASRPGGKRDPRDGQLYRPERVVTNVHTLQELVVYDGVTGPDAGRSFACTLCDWAMKFALTGKPK